MHDQMIKFADIGIGRGPGWCFSSREQAHGPLHKLYNRG